MKPTTNVIALLVLSVTIASCGSGHSPEYHFIVPEVNIVLLDELPTNVVVEKWYEAQDGKNVFGHSQVGGEKYVESASTPATIRILERSITTSSADPVTLVVRVRRGTDLREFKVSGVLMGNGDPKPVEYSVQFD